MQTTNTSKFRVPDLLILAISSLVLICFFCYIDEGYYNFRWAKDIYSLIGILVETSVILVGQLFVYNRMKKNNGRIPRLMISFIFGTLGVFATFFGTVYLIVLSYQMLTGNSI